MMTRPNQTENTSGLTAGAMSSQLTLEIWFDRRRKLSRKASRKRRWKPLVTFLMFLFNPLAARVCQPQDVTLHLKAGSYPVVSPENITFPKHFLSGEQRFEHAHFFKNLNFNRLSSAGLKCSRSNSSLTGWHAAWQSTARTREIGSESRSSRGRIPTTSASSSKVMKHKHLNYSCQLIERRRFALDN